MRVGAIEVSRYRRNYRLGAGSFYDDGIELGVYWERT